MRQPIASYAGTKADYVQPGDALPESVWVDFQPYGRVLLGNLRLEDNRNVLDVSDLVGTVLQGSETSFLCGHRKTRHIPAGTEHRRVYGLRVAELARAALPGGDIVRVAM